MDVKLLKFEGYPCRFRLGRLVSLLRIREGLTVREYAKQLQISHTLLVFIESGRQPISKELLDKISPQYYKLRKIAKEINVRDDLIQPLIELEGIVRSLPEDVRSALKIAVFKCLQDLISRFPEAGTRITAIDGRDGIVLHFPAAAWFSGSDIRRVLEGEDFVAFYPADVRQISTQVLVDYLLFLFDTVGYDIQHSSVQCTNAYSVVNAEWNEIFLRHMTDMLPATIEKVLPPVASRNQPFQAIIYNENLEKHNINLWNINEWGQSVEFLEGWGITEPKKKTQKILIDGTIEEDYD
jgi:transcriptional regulator with XRE-family HTH domain